MVNAFPLWFTYCHIRVLGKFADFSVCLELFQPTDRLKTEEEIAKEEKEKLEALEVSGTVIIHSKW